MLQHIGNLFGSIAVVLALAATAAAQPVPLHNATATYSQTGFGGQPVAQAIDGMLTNGNGWSIYEGSNNGNLRAVFTVTV